MTIRVGVAGASGRMGATVCEAVNADPDLQLVAAIDRGPISGLDTAVAVGTDPSTFVDARADVVVDFTVVGAARRTLPYLASHGIHAVVGTTGFGADDMETMRTGFTSSNCLLAANFAIGAVLMMRFAELAAPWFDTAEIIELHHDAKIDAPSGTAITTASRMAAASSTWAPDPTQHEVYAGARGGSGPAGIRIHSVRMRGMVAHQEVLLGTAGQTLLLRHDSYDRVSFMPGVLLACKRIAEHPGLTIGLDSFLGL